MTTAEAKLLLLDEKEVYRSLRDYSDYVKGFLPIYRKGQSQLASVEIEGFRSGIREKRIKFFESISSAYKRQRV